MNVPCRFCGRPVKIRTGVGRKKEGHSVCLEAETRFRQLADLLPQIRFQERHYSKKLRGDMFAVVNGPLHPHHVVFTPDDTSDPAIVYSSAKTNLPQEMAEEETT